MFTDKVGVNFLFLRIQWHFSVAILFIVSALSPQTSSLVGLKELDYLRALDDSISYRVVFKPFDELPEQYLAPPQSTTTSPTTGSPQTTTVAQSSPFAERAENQQQREEADEAGQDQQPLHSPAPSSSSSGTAEQNKLVKVVSADAEEYQCILPMLASSSKKRIESYHGPSPAQLIQSIYTEQICSYRIDPYWNYELCHGRYLLQYHEDKELKQRTEYFLGNFVAMNAEVEARHFDQLNPPTRKLGDEQLAYYPVTYTHGTAPFPFEVCDLTGKPRQTTVMYVCDEDARQNIHSINEVSSCHYELIVLSREICAHPSFQPSPANEYEIRCYASAPAATPDENGGDEPAASVDDPRPKALKKLEEEQHNEFIGEYGLLRSSSPFQIAKNMMAMLKAHLVDDAALEASLNQWDALFEAMKKAGGGAQQRGTEPTGGDEPAAEHQGRAGGDGASTAPHSPPKHGGAASSLSLVDRFWRGDVCLQGGTGWWKHEVCLGRTVSQYHEETAEDGTKQRRQTILLGRFDEAVHKAWATEHPGKAVERKLDGTVVQVAHMYTQGDVCIETGAHRDCQVRMKCREDINAQKVFIYMLEPSTCSYVVVLESSMFCSKLQHVDEFGLLSIDQTAGAGGGENGDEEEDEETAAATPSAKQRLKKRTFGDTTVVFDLANQEEIMRVVRQLLEGVGDGQVLVSAAKLKFGKNDESTTAAGVDEHGDDKRRATPSHGDNETPTENVGGEQETTAPPASSASAQTTTMVTDNETERERADRSRGETVQQQREEETTVQHQQQQKEEERETAHGEESSVTEESGESKSQQSQKTPPQLIGHVQAERGGEL